MEDRIKGRILELKDEVVALRRDIHMHPEIGFEEFRTSGIVKQYLEACGIEATTITSTGVVGLLKGGKPGPVVMLRADLDALTVTEENDIPYKSQNEGKSHACGHDGHTAMLLVAAKILAEEKEKLCGTVKFCFEPNEEGEGAELMISDGVLENPPVDVCLGLHLWQGVPLGKIGLKAGGVMAGMACFRLVIHGESGHSSEPHKSVDAITAASALVSNISLVEKWGIGVEDHTVITICTINGGTALNAICDTVEMTGSLRFMYDPSEEFRQRPIQRFEKLVKNVCEMYGTTYTMDMKITGSVLDNDKKVVEHMRPVAEEIIGEENIIPYSCMGGEDFAEFVRRVPGAFVFIGIGTEEGEGSYPQHHPKFNFDEETLLTGVELHVKGALSYLK